MQQKMQSLKYGIVLLYWACLCVQCHGDCIKVEDSITCSEIPQRLPNGCRRVYIKGIDIRHYRIDFPLEYWKNVTFLDIETDKGDRFFNPSKPLFRNLSSLQTLGIHGKYLTVVDKEIFEGLLALKTLDLSNCYHLDMYELGKVFLLNGSVPNIENLYLTNVMGITASPIYLSTSIIDNIAKRPIRSLNVSGMSFSKIETQQLSRSLEVFNASNTFGVIDTIFDNFYTNLKTIDISGIQLRRVGIDFLKNINYSTILNFDIGKCCPSLESIYFNQMAFGVPNFEFRINSATFTCIDPNIRNLSNLFLRENNIKWLNISCINCSGLAIKLLDMSGNGLEYISPHVLTTFSPEVIDFHANSLYIMETFQDFEQLFKLLTKLRKVNLSNNMITYLPKYLFINNINFEILDLSTNRLKTLTLSLKHLNKLKHLNLKQNSLTIINQGNF